MKRRPQSWSERFSSSLEERPSPALEDWRWAREGEEPADSRAVDAAWDLVTLHASAEAAKLNHAIRALPSEAHRTLFPALVVAAARVSEVGAFCVRDGDKPWFPRDLAFVPGREHLEPDLELTSMVEVGRNVVDFRLWYRTQGFAKLADDDLREVVVERTMAILLGEGTVGRRGQRDERYRDIELQQEGYLVVRYERSDIWRDPVGCAEEALRTLTETARFDCEATLQELERSAAQL
ncbi:MAG: hypothetical protein H6721_07045 [Sandaracinus sp.]|nr:hypothetical protein [Sandaracinus sp.]